MRVGAFPRDFREASSHVLRKYLLCSCSSDRYCTSPSSYIIVLTFQDLQQIKVITLNPNKDCLTKSAPITRHGHERAQASSDHALGPAQRRLFERTSVLVQKGVDTVGGWRTTISHHRLCG